MARYGGVIYKTKKRENKNVKTLRCESKILKTENTLINH